MGLRRVLQALVVLSVANFALFVVVGLCIGGDAWSGVVRDGHYFLNSKGHFTEVSRPVFLYSKWHLYSVLVTHPLGLLSILLLKLGPSASPARFRGSPSSRTG
jgi:hypothetical protein